MECGTPVPQVKKCVQFGLELPLKAKFCFECGLPQVDSSSFGLGTSVSMGDKNVIAGDVIGQKVSGDNVCNKILGCATFTSVQDIYLANAVPGLFLDVSDVQNQKLP